MFAQRWLSGRRVWLEHDDEFRDRYGRRLAYVWLEPPASKTFVLIRSKMFNAVLLAEGCAKLLIIPPNVRYAEVFRTLEQEARANTRGLWKAGLFLRDRGAPACDASYPDVCIPPPPPDLDCRDVTYRRFRVMPPDPHRFDGDGDGIGCER